MNQLEKDIEKKLRRMVERHGGQCLKWVCPGWSGVPDRIVVMPGGCIYFVETKRPKDGELSELQKWWIDRLRGLGFYAGTVFDDADVRAFGQRITGGKSCYTCKHKATFPFAEPCAGCEAWDRWEASKDV